MNNANLLLGAALATALSGNVFNQTLYEEKKKFETVDEYRKRETSKKKRAKQARRRNRK